MMIIGVDYHPSFQTDSNRHRKVAGSKSKILEPFYYGFFVLP